MKRPETLTKQGRRRSAFTLIEMLVVIAIMGILAGLLIPAVSLAIQRARNARNKNTCYQIETALNNYLREYGTMPPASLTGINTDGTVCRTDQGIVELLSGSNTNFGNFRRIAFIEITDRDLDANGNLVDSWDERFYFTVDHDYNGKLTVPWGSGSVELRRTAAVWSSGKDGSVGGTNDNLTTWL